MTRLILVAALLFAVTATASAQLMYLGYGTGGDAGGGAPTCSATNGQTDLSFCSNAIYDALIF